MRVIALTYFADKDDFTKRYVKGEVYDMQDDRAMELIGKGLVMSEKAEVPETPKTKPPKSNK